jgi:hypothetical protein
LYRPFKSENICFREAGLNFQTKTLNQPSVFHNKIRRFK